ncbi:MAG: hypothetical protein KBG15_01120, partial [Kofleriaceae bacterium]|nr:hypothetical protein [Kofleriaceae bacterium]
MSKPGQRGDATLDRIANLADGWAAPARAPSTADSVDSSDVRNKPRTVPPPAPGSSARIVRESQSPPMAAPLLAAAEPMAPGGSTPIAMPTTASIELEPATLPASASVAVPAPASASVSASAAAPVSAPVSASVAAPATAPVAVPVAPVPSGRAKAPSLPPPIPPRAKGASIPPPLPGPSSTGSVPNLAAREGRSTSGAPAVSPRDGRATGSVPMMAPREGRGSGAMPALPTHENRATGGVPIMAPRDGRGTGSARVPVPIGEFGNAPETIVVDPAVAALGPAAELAALIERNAPLGAAPPRTKTVEREVPVALLREIADSELRGDSTHVDASSSLAERADLTGSDELHGDATMVNAPGSSGASGGSLRVAPQLPQRRGLGGDVRYVFTVLFGASRARRELSTIETEQTERQKSRRDRLITIGKSAISSERFDHSEVATARDRFAEIEEQRSGYA